MGKTLQFSRWTCSVEYPGRYGNGRLAIVLADAVTGERVATATVNVPEATVGPNEVLVQNYSENAGILDSLEAAGILRRTGREIPTGRVVATVCTMVDPDAPPACETRGYSDDARYRVLCPVHGNIQIGHAKYNRQMSMANEPWRCPECGGRAEFDDDAYEAGGE